MCSALPSPPTSPPRVGSSRAGPHMSLCEGMVSGMEGAPGCPSVFGVRMGVPSPLPSPAAGDVGHLAALPFSWSFPGSIPESHCCPCSLLGLAPPHIPCRCLQAGAPATSAGWFRLVSPSLIPLAAAALVEGALLSSPLPTFGGQSALGWRPGQQDPPLLPRAGGFSLLLFIYKQL